MSNILRALKIGEKVLSICGTLLSTLSIFIEIAYLNVIEFITVILLILFLSEFIRELTKSKLNKYFLSFIIIITIWTVICHIHYLYTYEIITSISSPILVPLAVIAATYVFKIFADWEGESFTAKLNKVFLRKTKVEDKELLKKEKLVLLWGLIEVSTYELLKTYISLLIVSSIFIGVLVIMLIESILYIELPLFLIFITVSFRTELARFLKKRKCLKLLEFWEKKETLENEFYVFLLRQILTPKGFFYINTMLIFLIICFIGLLLIVFVCQNPGFLVDVLDLALIACYNVSAFYMLYFILKTIKINAQRIVAADVHENVIYSPYFPIFFLIIFYASDIIDLIYKDLYKYICIFIGIAWLIKAVKLPLGLRRIVMSASLENRLIILIIIFHISVYINALNHNMTFTSNYILTAYIISGLWFSTIRFANDLNIKNALLFSITVIIVIIYLYVILNMEITNIYVLALTLLVIITVFWIIGKIFKNRFKKLFYFSLLLAGIKVKEEES